MNETMKRALREYAEQRTADLEPREAWKRAYEYARWCRQYSA